MEDQHVLPKHWHCLLVPNYTASHNIILHAMRLLSSTMKTTKGPRQPTHNHSPRQMVWRRWLLLSATIKQFTNRNGVTNTAVRAWRLAGTHLVPRNVSSLTVHKGRHIVKKSGERSCECGRVTGTGQGRARSDVDRRKALYWTLQRRAAKKGPN